MNRIFFSKLLLFAILIFSLSSCQQIRKWKAQLGNTSEQIKLGKQYSEGDGVTKNLIEAAKWYQRAADDGDAEGLFLLGT
ncbi:MAG: hypothetical protein Q4A15_09615, partial [Prevotellaceae bacterium]|nr:hypothetical protein [Prevotellaceae bacterium]